MEKVFILFHGGAGIVGSANEISGGRTSNGLILLTVAAILVAISFTKGEKLGGAP